MTSAVSQSSVGTVIEDLVSDRNIPLKVCMIILNIAQLFSCWIAVAYFIKNYEIWSQLELTLSLVLLLLGNYFIPCIANAVIYGRRWKRSSVSNRRKIEEENKQAWVCLRISLSLTGLPTVGRYIETIIVSNKLRILENKHVKESVVCHKEGSQLNPIGTSRIGSTVNQLKSGNIQRNNSVISGMSQASSTGIPESGQRKVRKARRQYRRCEHDGSLMALISGSVGAGPMAIGLGFLYFQREEKHAMQTDQMTAVFMSFVFNILWLAATLTHFYPARHVLSEAEFERGIRPSHFWSLVLLYASHLIQVTLRVICFVIFVNWFYAYVCIPIVFHWLLGTFLLVGYRAYMKSATVARPVGERLAKETASFMSAMFFGYVGIFDFVNGNQGKTRLRYLIYYLFYYIENVAMLVIWILRNPTTQIRYPIPFLCSVLGLFWLGIIFFQLYLYYFSYSPYGSSIIGICFKRNRRSTGNYAEEVCEPVFGVPVAQSAVPFWRLSSHGDSHQYDGSRVSGVTVSNVSQPRPLRQVSRDQIKSSSSILSSQSQNTTPSIFSQPGSQLNHAQDRPRINPAIRQPPVIQQKLRNENALPPSKIGSATDSSSSSSSGDEDLAVFTPRIVARKTQSEPDMFFPPSASTQQSVSGTPTHSTRVSSNQDMYAHSKVTPGDRDHTHSQSDLTTHSTRPNSRLALSGQFKAAPMHQEHTDTPVSTRSLDQVPVKVVQPSFTTKRIGVPSKPLKTGTLRPLPSNEQLKTLRHRRDSRSLPPRAHTTKAGRRH